jgi:hypothetical protein
VNRSAPLAELRASEARQQAPKAPGPGPTPAGAASATFLLVLSFFVALRMPNRIKVADDGSSRLNHNL